MDNEKDFREIDENGLELSDVKETEIHEEHPEDEYEDVCFICHRPESKAGKMIHLTPEIHICAECMQRTMDMMNNGNVDYNKMDFSRMPNISMINLSDLQNMIPKRQKVKKKNPEKEENILCGIMNWQEPNDLDIFPTPALGEWKQYSSLTSMVLDLNAGNVEYLLVPASVASYLKAQDDSLTIAPGGAGVPTEIRMAVRAEDTELHQLLQDGM